MWLILAFLTSNQVLNKSMQKASCNQNTSSKALFIFSLSLIFIFVAVPLLSFTQNNELIINVSALRNSKGFVHISLYNKQKGFPSDPATALRSYSVAARAPEVRLAISDLSPGEYAIAIIHDENGNNILDTNFAGAPVEGYGSSGSNRRFGPPVWERSRFILNSGKVHLTIKANYLL